MKVKVRRVGNSLTVTIPKEIAVDACIGPDTEMNVSIRGQVVVMEPVEAAGRGGSGRDGGSWPGRGLGESDIEAAIAEARGRPRA